MDKLKNILSPGHQQDDEVLYRSDHSTNAGKISGEGSHFKDARETGLSSHAVNPSDSQYGQSGYGNEGTATSNLPDRTSQTKQTLNPVDREYGESRYGTTGTTEPTHTSAAGVDAPVGGTFQSSGHDVATRTERDAGIISTPSAADDDDASIASIRSSVIGDAPQTKQLTDSATPAGTGTDRHFPLAGGSVAGHGRTGDYGVGDTTTGTTGRDPILSGATGSYDDQRAEPRVTGSHGIGSTPGGGPVGGYGNTETTGAHGAHGSHGHEALAGAAAAASTSGHGHGHGNEGIDTRTTDTTGPHFASGPHVTDTANRLDPHVNESTGSTTGPPSASHIGSSGAETTAGYGSGVGATSTSPGYSAYNATAGPTSHEQGHHYGRDAAIAGGVGAAGAGLYEARSKGSTAEDPASMTHGPHKSNVMNVMDPRVLPDSDKMKGHHAESTATDPALHTTGPHKSDILNVLDPRVLPEPEKMKQHTTAGPHQSDTLNRIDPNVDSDLSRQQGQHHYGRDATLAGGAGANAYEGNKRLHNVASSQQTVSPQQGQHQHGRDFGFAGGAHEGNKRLSATAGPHQSDTMNRADPRVDSDRSQQGQHHYGRDATLAGGAGAAGFGAYEADKHHKNTAGPHQSDTMNRADPRVDSDLSQQGQHYKSTAGPHQSDTLNRADPRVDSDRSQQSQHHHGRDAALAGGAGAGAAGAYEAAKHHNDNSNPYTATAIDPRVDGNRRTSTTQRGPATATYGSTAGEGFHASQPQDHQYRRDAAGAPGVGAAGAGAPYNYAQREAEKAEKERIKKLEKEAKKNEPEEKKHHGILGFLHRDKDKKDKHAEEPTGTHHSTTRDTVTTGHPDTTEKAAHRAEEAALGTGAIGGGAGAEHERNRLHKDPPADHPAAQGNQGEQYGMSGGLGQPGAASEFGSNDPNVHPMGDDGIVIEPRTGLPMNVGKYGPGEGGTDANPAIHGYHGEPTGAEGTTGTTGNTGTIGNTSTTSHMTGTGSSVGHGTGSY